MRNKKSNWPLYLVAAILLAAFVLVVVREAPLKIEHVEEAVPVDLG